MTAHVLKLQAAHIPFIEAPLRTQWDIAGDAVAKFDVPGLWAIPILPNGYALNLATMTLSRWPEWYGVARSRVDAKEFADSTFSLRLQMKSAEDGLVDVPTELYSRVSAIWHPGEFAPYDEREWRKLDAARIDAIMTYVGHLPDTPYAHAWFEQLAAPTPYSFPKKPPMPKPFPCPAPT